MKRGLHGTGTIRRRKGGHNRSGDIPCGVRTNMGGDIHGKRTTWNEISRRRERGHTQRGYIRRGETHGMGTHREWTYTIKGLHREERGDRYGERTHTEMRYIRSGVRPGGGGDIHSKGTTRKRERNHTERVYIWRGDTHGVGKHTGGGHTC